ncbi:MAG: carbamoyltransferase HypF [Comamonadaceae bacterium]|nr:carbamoyltransferase HypF [Comamonadaceae bacterium]
MALILAFGAFLKNTACLFDSEAPHATRWSSVHGDLSDPAACVALRDSVTQLMSMSQANSPIAAVAHDLHPDFFSTHLALQTAAELQVPVFAVQHHHAHIATVMAEHGLSQPVLGLALDGVGLGNDGLAWGGELLRVDAFGFERLAHLLPLALPGGDVAAREPWRMAAAVLHALGAPDQIQPRFGPVVGEQAAKTITTMLARGLNCPQTTAAGRWFDAVAGLLGLSVRQEFEAQAAIALEAAAARRPQSHAGAVVNTSLWNITPDGEVDLRPWLREHLLKVDTHNPAAVDKAALSFHLTLADALSQHTIALARAHQITDVALGGGCFFNQILKKAIVVRLEAAGLKVLQTQSLSCGDAALALGQAWVACFSLPASLDL